MLHIFISNSDSGVFRFFCFNYSPSIEYLYHLSIIGKKQSEYCPAMAQSCIPELILVYSALSSHPGLKILIHVSAFEHTDILYAEYISYIKIGQYLFINVAVHQAGFNRT